jgi:hypothetical protein
MLATVIPRARTPDRALDNDLLTGMVRRLHGVAAQVPS